MSKQAHQALDTTEAKVKKPPHRFKPGAEWTGNAAGRPKGARHKLDGLFVEALYKDFKEGGVAAIQKCREQKPAMYLKVIADILPKDVNVKADKSLADLADGLSAVAQFLGQVAAEASGPDHEGIVPDRPLLSAGARAQTH